MQPFHRERGSTEFAEKLKRVAAVDQALHLTDVVIRCGVM
jgi:hypothetical protein